MSKDPWQDIYEEELAEALERGIKHPEEWAVTQATKRDMDEEAMALETIYDHWRDRAALGDN